MTATATDAAGTWIRVATVTVDDRSGMLTNQPAAVEGDDVG